MRIDISKLQNVAFETNRNIDLFKLTLIKKLKQQINFNNLELYYIVFTNQDGRKVKLPSSDLSATFTLKITLTNKGKGLFTGEKNNLICKWKLKIL
ncbi:hypothetical protein [Spiroplasma endosymbiont of Poecilobothrus nobilitatus]|uniref:hypothetical protein n=1 Tax=Spiroplasma endosymbiont of Poecilobothrus nobilitatus TaxID=1209220 RepID=UPI00313EFAFE